MLLKSMGSNHPLKTPKTPQKKNIAGEKVRRTRMSKNPPVSLEDLAGKLAVMGLSIDRSAIGRMEIGKRYILDYELVAIAKALTVKVSDLTGVL
jgi:hypothetical protein